ncbi:MAG TPA: hypothetical protein VIG73_12380 [Cerasibacillus sp.]|uniref:hypothetical protein n=1 Tax=Cerasibacillus sp. TaxID=2498711 RepID=UPI002F3FA521
MKKQLYYVTGNTGAGFVNLLSSNVTGLEHIFVLKHPSHRLKTAVLNQVSKKINIKTPLEILCSSSGTDYEDGLIIREKSIAIITEDVSSPLHQREYIERDLSRYGMFSYLTEAEDNRLKRDYQKNMEKAYEQFNKGLSVHDQLEAIFISQMDFSKADQVASEFIENILHDVPKRKRNAHVYHRLFGTNTKNGAVNVVPELLNRVSRGYFIKGRAGTGKSTLMKKILVACEEYGYDVELYHCSFDPDSIDMVLVPELDFCIFDSTDPHEYFPRREGQEIIDMYQETVKKGTDEQYMKQIKEVTEIYQTHMKQGMQYIKEAGELLEDREERFKFNKSDVDRIADELLYELKHLSPQRY